MTAQPSAPLKDLKEGLSSARKADLTHVRTPFMVYTSRPCEYGSVKYERSNFMRRVSIGDQPSKADFERFRSYLRAAASHIFQVLDSMEAHQANDPSLLDIEGMKRAAYAVDTDVTPGAKVGASMLPHIAPACASLNMAITQATACGLLPVDPGTPWAAPKQEPGKAESTVINPHLIIPTRFATVGEHAAALAAIPKEANAFSDVVDKLDQEIENGFRQTNPDYPKGVDM